MSDKTQGDSEVLTRTRQVTQKPRLYKVLLHNDDYTTMEFVVWLLMTVFHLDLQKSQEVMMRVHRSGIGVAGVYTKEVAETKVAKSIELARQHEFPLECSMEPE